MSAFAVFSMIGIYPVVPGVPVYDIGSPVFTKVTIHLENGKTFVISAPASSRDNKYVQTVVWNGKVLSHLWIKHNEVSNGGKLEVKMGDTPNYALGAASNDFPAPPELD